MSGKPRTTQDAEKFDHNADRYPNFVQILRRLIQDADIPDEPIMRLELTTLANGDATYRVWTARAEEPDGGFLPAGTTD